MNADADPDLTITDAQEARKCLSEFHAFAASHDAVSTACHVADDETAETLDMVGVLRTWLRRYADALR